MNTHGHNEVSEVGADLLKEAFKGRMNNPRLGAFYLGNWITDLSQVIDPVAGATLREKIKVLVDDMFDTLLNGTWYRVMDKLVPLENYVEYGAIASHKPKLVDAIDAFFNYIIQPGKDQHGKATPSPWYKAVQPGVLLKGYFKFVHPEQIGPPRMDLGAYLHVFDTLFTQYYPHEHMDRPSHLSAPADKPITDPSTGAVKYEDRKPTAPVLGSGLYDYLHEYIDINAGLLAELDLNWASVYLKPVGNITSDSDLKWNEGLGKLGQALHAVEDFFAHSNFIEHAAKVMGGEYVPKFYEFDNHRFLKRLKRYNYQDLPGDWTKNAEEDFVVTGYFDFTDTLVSLLHMFEDGLMGLLDRSPRDPTRDMATIYGYVTDVKKTDTQIMQQADKVVHDFLEVVDDPRKLNKENKDNTMVAAILWFIENTPLNEEIKFIEAVLKPTTDVATFEQLVARMPIFKDIQQLSAEGHIQPQHAARVLKALFDFIRQMTIEIRYAQFSTSVYKTARSIAELYASPPKWILNFLSEKTADLVIDYGLFLAKEGLYYALGLERVGSHSLLAKDHGKEWLYEHNEACAKASHYYIVNTLLRWRDPAAHTLPENQKWVDWRELLEHFLCHPAHGVACGIPREIGVEIAHTITPEERDLGLEQLLKKLAPIYQPLALKPPGLPPFTDKTILHGNASVKTRRLNWVAIAEQTIIPLSVPWAGAPLHLRRFIIPQLKQQVMVCDPSALTPKWYMAIMKDGWEKVKTESGHSVKYHPDRSKAEDQMKLGKNMRQHWETWYRPG